MRIEHTIEIDAPVSRVWEVTLDVESWPRYTPTINSVELLDTGPLTVGSGARIKQPGQTAKVWTVTRLDDERTFAWSTRALGTTMTGIHEMRPCNGGTVNVLAVEIRGRFAPLVGGLLRRPMLSAITKENQGFKAAAEAKTTPDLPGPSTRA